MSEEKLTLTQLLGKIGDDNITYQNLDTDFVEFKDGKRGAKITFATGEKIDGARAMLGAGPTQKMGLIIWLDRDHVANVMEGLTPNGEVPDGE